jgi:hypothetical protein
MKEEYLHYLYRLKLLGNQFQTTDGRSLEVLSFGYHNQNAGPDFMEAKIMLDGQLWAGPVEFHVKSSDWYAHGHQNDKHYNNVIVHFVFAHDQDVYSGDYKLPVVELKSRIDRDHFKRYQNLARSTGSIACQNQVKTVEPFIIFQQKERALANRLLRKAGIILKSLDETKGDADLTFYRSLALVFGGKVNAVPFSQLIEKIGLKTLWRCEANEVIIPALLFGISGLLPAQSGNAYVSRLIAEFTFQKYRLRLAGLPPESWRYSRMHPQAFPDVRIAQFAAFVTQKISPAFFLQDNLDVKSIRNLFELNVPPYWKHHYRFETPTRAKSACLSRSFVDLVIINSIVPFIFANAMQRDDATMKERAVNLLAELAPEQNSILEKWSELGVHSANAFDSQALIEQKNEFCSAKKCLFCRIGTNLLRA